MLIEVGRLFIYLMLVVFGVVATIKSPETLSQYPVDVLGFPDVFIFAHEHDIRLNEVLFESRGLAEKTLDYTGVILREHGRNGIPFSGKFKDRKVIIVLT